MSEADNDSEVMDEWAEAMEESGDTNKDEGTGADDAVAEQASPQQDASPAGLENLRDDSSDCTEDVNMDVILDVPVTLSMEIGSTKVNIRNLLQLNQGSVIELDRMAGEPLDVKVNGTLIAHGEVVVVNEKFGIRLTDVISPAERVRKLK